MKGPLFLVILFFLAGCAAAKTKRSEPELFAGRDLWALLIEGRTCQKADDGHNALCEYRVGEGLHFSIFQAERVTVQAESENSEYYFSFDLQSDCVQVMKGRYLGKYRSLEAPDNMAWVSIADFKIYRTQFGCETGEEARNTDHVLPPLYPPPHRATK